MRRAAGSYFDNQIAIINVYFSKVSGFSDVEEYYKDSSSSNFMEKVEFTLIFGVGCYFIKSIAP